MGRVLVVGADVEVVEGDATDRRLLAEVLTDC